MAAANSTAPALTAKQIARFWSKVAKGEPADCWPWTGYVHKSKAQCLLYGYFWLRPGKGYGAHVVARFLATGEWPAGLHTLHACDNRPCCNPAHLFLGTALDNSEDMMVKRRHVAVTRPDYACRGERHGRAKVTAAQVVEIRRLYATGRNSLAKLGRQFGVSNIAIRLIVKRINWQHVP